MYIHSLSGSIFLFYSEILFFIFILINHYSYSGALTYDEGPHPPQEAEGVIQPLSRSLLTFYPHVLIIRY